MDVKALFETKSLFEETKVVELYVNNSCPLFNFAFYQASQNIALYNNEYVNVYY